MTPEDVAAHFTRSDGSYFFARWGRPLAPVVFGVEDATLATVKGALEAIVTLADHKMAETDPELGANLLMFFVKSWQELLDAPGVGKLVPDLLPLIDTLRARQANQYRIFRFDETGAIKAAFVFLKIDAALAQVPAETLALSEAAQTILLWSDTAFRDTGPLAALPEDKGAVLRPDIAAIIRAAYDPVMPPFSEDAAHALRLHARLSQPS
ncbi:MAG: hypothetical protein QNJ13_03805 [Paracoccaceae bacterium]|nr:hypothetical protein [Paracoccaceae bacterium]